METLVTFVMGTVTKEDTRKRPKLELVAIIRTKVRIASAAKNFEKFIVRFSIEKFVEGRDILSNFGRKSIN